MHNHGVDLLAGRFEQRFESTVPVMLERGHGTVRNVSANGIYFVTSVALEPGATVKFTMQFADFPGGPIEVNCIANVVRVEERGANRGVGAAIRSFEFRRMPSPTASS